MSNKEAIEKTMDLIEAAILALEKINATETICVETLLKETRKYTDQLYENMEA